MSELLTILQGMIQDELKSLRLGDIAVVTANRPKTSEDDTHHHTVDVKLRHVELELLAVPICTPHIGMVSAPRVGDLVLLTYVNGDPNHPIVVGRLHSNEAPPPLHEDNEWRVEAPFQGNSSIAIDKEESVVIPAGETVVTVRSDGSVEIAGKEDFVVKVDGNVQLECADAEIKASGKISLGDGGGGVITTTSHKCFYSGAPLVGSQNVTAMD